MTPRLLPIDMLEHARRLRRESTDAEALLWGLLRNRQFGGFKFRRQVPVPPYILDLYCTQARLAVEVDGGQHAQPAQSAHDEARTAFLGRRGIRVLRFWNVEVVQSTEVVAGQIWDALHHPHPDPLPQAGEGEDAHG